MSQTIQQPIPETPQVARKPYNFGAMSALFAGSGIMFGLFLMILTQASPCNSSFFSFSWMMSSQRSTTECAFTTIVALIALTVSTQLLLMSCFLVTMCHFGRTGAKLQVHTTHIAYHSIDIVTIARLGFIATLISGYSVVLIILFPAYGRCNENNDIFRPGFILDKFHEYAVLFYLVAMLIASFMATRCMDVVYKHTAVIATSMNRQIFDYCQSVSSFANRLCPQVFGVTLYMTILEVVGTATLSSDNVEGNVAKWELVFLIILAALTMCLAVLLYHSRTYMHLI